MSHSPNHDAKAEGVSAEDGPNFQGGAPVSRFVTPGGHPIDNSQPAFPVFHRKFGNPAPLGLMAFGGTTVLLSFYNLQTRGVKVPNVLVGMALMYGGLCQIIAGVLEWACGNSFGCCAFTGFGAFWISWGMIQIPWFGITAAYTSLGPEGVKMLAQALGLYLFVWGIIVFLHALALFRGSIALLFVFLDITVTFFILGAAEFTGNAKLTKAGGGFGIIGGFAAMYVAISGLLTPDTSYFTLPVGNLAPTN